MAQDKTKEELLNELNLLKAEHETLKKSFVTELKERSFVVTDLEILNTLNAGMNKGACIDELLEKSTIMITKAFNVNHTDVYLASDDGMFLLYESRKIKKEHKSFLEKVFPEKLPENLKIPLTSDNWYSKTMAGNDIRVTQSKVDVESMVMAFVEGTYGKIPFKKYVTKFVSYIKKSSIIASLPLSLKGKKIALLDINFREVPTEMDLIRIRKLAEQIVIIIARKQSELLILQQNKELEKHIADKDRLLSILGHDLRSPFNSIIGFTDLILENLPELDAATLESYLNQVNTSARSTYYLLENLLLWARSQSGRLSFKPQINSLRDLCLEELETLGPQALKKDIHIKVFIADKIKVYGDSNMLKAVIRNLTANAIKYTGKGGNVDISAEKQKKGVLFTVADSGGGKSEKN